MIRLATIAVTLAALLAGAATAAQDPGGAVQDPPSAPPADVEAADELMDFDPLKIVCRRVRPPTGTRLVGQQTRQQMCMSRTDWEQQELDAQEALRERDKGVCSGSSCSG